MTLTTFLLLLLVITINNCVLVIILDKNKYVDEFYCAYTVLLTLKGPIEKKIEKNIIEGKHSLIVVHTLMLPLMVSNGMNNVSGITEEKKLNVKGVRIIGSKNINIDEVIAL